MRDETWHTMPYGTVRRVITARTAAPEGGAWRRLRSKVRGCVFMALAAVALTAPPLAAQDTPSGQTVTLHEVLVDAVGTESWLRFRFVAPQIARDGGDVTYAQAEADFQHLCDTVARPYVAQHGLVADVIVISLMDRPVAFGQADAAATQFFEAFRLPGDACIWEAF